MRSGFRALSLSAVANGRSAYSGSRYAYLVIWDGGGDIAGTMGRAQGRVNAANTRRGTAARPSSSIASNVVEAAHVSTASISTQLSG